jgi:hypothetical protein
MARRTGTHKRGSVSFNQKLFVRRDDVLTHTVFEWKGEFTKDFVKCIEGVLFSINNDKSLDFGFGLNAKIGQILVRDGSDVEAFTKKDFEAKFIEICSKG